MTVTWIVFLNFSDKVKVLFSLKIVVGDKIHWGMRRQKLKNSKGVVYIEWTSCYILNTDIWLHILVAAPSIILYGCIAIFFSHVLIGWIFRVCMCGGGGGGGRRFEFGQPFLSIRTQSTYWNFCLKFLLLLNVWTGGTLISSVCLY